MPDEFDPYYLWLGTPPEDQPFHAYKMLGLKLYESDPQIIATAADQRIAHVRTFRDGPRAVWSETLLGELTTIKLNLLNPEARAEYDQRLRRHFSAQTAEVAAVEPAASDTIPTPEGVEPAATVGPLFAAADASSGSRRIVASRSGRHPRRRSAGSQIASIVLGGVLGLAIGYSLLCNLKPSADFLGIFPARGAARPAAGK